MNNRTTDGTLTSPVPKHSFQRSVESRRFLSLQLENYFREDWSRLGLTSVERNKMEANLRSILAILKSTPRSKIKTTAPTPLLTGPTSTSEAQPKGSPDYLNWALSL